MNEAIDTIIAEAVRLPADQRLTVAHRILSSVEPEASKEADAAWDKEIRDRIDRYDAGKTQGIPAKEVFDELSRRLRQ
jgi:putative addiction module component (TIGR02574 family)